MTMQRRYSKRELLGRLRVDYLFSTDALPGITPGSSRWEVLAAFLKAGEARAERLIETDGGLIFLQSIPHRPNTGAIYVYNEATRAFLWMRFDRDDDLNGGDFDTLGSQILDMAYSQMQCVWDGYFLRGGVDIGYWYYDKGLLVSPAMIGAYKEEQQRACYPVISISKQLYKLLRDDPGRGVYSKDADPLPDQFCSFMHPDKGRVYYINYLRLAVKSLDWQYDRATYEAYMAAPRGSDAREKIMDEEYYRNLAGFFQRHKDLIVSAHKVADDKVKAKYQFLADYHNRELLRVLPKQPKLRITL